MGQLVDLKIALSLLFLFTILACTPQVSTPKIGESDATIPDSSNPIANSPTTISHTLSNNIFQWSFSCGTGECHSGTFIGGEYWIAPKKPGDEVKLLSVTATGAQSGGLEINPTNPSKQGFLSCKSSYDATLDFSSSLPKVISLNSSLVKATWKATGCYPNGSTCCVDKYGVVTVLPAPPVNNGGEAFRPGMAGNLKRVFYLSDFDLTRIPSLSIVNQTTFAASFSATHTRWHTAYVDHYMWKLGDGARSFAPTGVPDYGATQGMVYLGDLLRAMGTEPISEKRVAITGLIQRGIDLYASYKNGIRWPSGAGQQAGRKPAVTFFASLLRADDAIKTEIRGIAANNGNDFHEDGQVQVYATKGNTPIWGDPCNENTYWAQLFYAQKYDGGSNVQIGSGDNSRTCGDPHGYIDGPAGYPGTFYMACCSTGEFISYQLAQSLMPDYCSVANDPHLSIYTRRVLNEGLHSQPDPCAPPDPRENLNCAAYAAGAPNCLYYKKTWGPDPAKPGDCIRNGVGQNGRHPGAHGTFMPSILNESLISKKLREMQGNSILNGCNL